MSIDERYYRAYNINARIAGYLGLTGSILSYPNVIWSILAIALVLSMLAVFFEHPSQQKKVVTIWLIGMALTLVIGLIVSNWLIRIILYVVFSAVLTALLFEGAGPNGLDKESE